MIGLRVGPFEIVETADVPEPGDWYYARRSGMSQRKPSEVLVRVLPPDADADARLELQQHFDNLRQVEHARVPIAVAMYEGVGAMAITAVRGTSLAHVIAGREDDSVAMSPATLLDLLLEVAEILQYAHHRGRAHGHLEPRHLLIAADGTVWVLGFAAGPGEPTAPEWTSPERNRGEASSEATDQWSLAAMGCALITGRAPWQGDESRSGDAESIVGPVEKQWPALARLFRKMLDNRPSNRHPTMHQVRQELLALARKAGGTSARRDLAAKLNQVEALDETEQGAPERVQDAGQTLEPPESESDEVHTAPRVPPPERETVDLKEHGLPPPDPQPEPEPEPEPELPDDPSSEVEGPEIQTARTVQTSSRKAGRSTPLPAEQIPVVRPDIDGDVPDAERGRTPARLSDRMAAPASDPRTLGPDTPLQDTTGPTMLADVQALAKQHGIDMSLFTDSEEPAAPGTEGGTDAEPNIDPHPAHDPKSVADPPSLPQNLDVGDPEDAADYEATVVFSAHTFDDVEGFALAESSGDVEVQVEYVDDEKTPTLTPPSDGDMPSEELPAPVPSPVPADPSAAAIDDFLPNRVPSSVGEEPELGSMNRQVSIRNEPALGLDDDGDRGPSAPLPPAPSSGAQRFALGAIGVMVVLMLVWAATQILQ